MFIHYFYPQVRAVLIGYQQPQIVARPNVFKSSLNLVLLIIILFSLSAAILLFGPRIYFKFANPTTKPVASEFEQTVLGGDIEAGTNTEQSQEISIPEQNLNLPKGDWLSISKIGVNSSLQATADYQEALKTGIWMDPEFGRPGDQDKPMIVAAHRYGWKWWWQDDYWKYNSFYLLPDTEPGDIVEVISDQRLWTYEIYAGEEGEEISDYDADLILYTCKYLNSPIRHFRYARLIDPTSL